MGRCMEGWIALTIIVMGFLITLNEIVMIDTLEGRIVAIAPSPFYIGVVILVSFVIAFIIIGRNMLS